MRHPITETTTTQRRHRRSDRCIDRCIDLPPLMTAFLVVLLAALGLVMVTAAGCSVTSTGGSGGMGGGTITVRPTLTPRPNRGTPGPLGAPAADRLTVPKVFPDRRECRRDRLPGVRETEKRRPV